MAYPQLARRKTSRMMIDTFAGYDHNLKIAEGEFYETENLTTAYYPLFANRAKRGVVSGQYYGELQGLIAKDALCWVNDGTLYKNGQATPVTGLTAGQKQLVSMGAYIVIFPDKKYFNTQNSSDYGSLEAEWRYPTTGNGSYTCQPCDVDGMPYTVNHVTSVEPTAPNNGDIWLDTGKMTLSQYSSVQMTWVSIESVYTKVQFGTTGQIGQLFRDGDGVTVAATYTEESGGVTTSHTLEALSGSHILYKVGQEGGSGNDYVILVGLIGQTASYTGSVTIKRSVPQMNFVCECQNRLWGCYYGPNGDSSAVLNEIYCCALGDFKNWSIYQGISTDSWTASVGSDGAWTGAVNYRGHPTFFKEDHIHVVTVSATGAHSIQELLCGGVQEGSDRSLAVVNETLYYKTRTGVAAWQGGMPQVVSAALGDVKYYGAVAGVFGQRYYISMKDASDAWHLFVFDTEHGLWMREDGLQVESFAKVDDELYAQVRELVPPEPEPEPGPEPGEGTEEETEESEEETEETEEETETEETETEETEPVTVTKLLALNGTDGTPEDAPAWLAETGIMYYEYPDQKYVSRYDIRLQMGTGASMTLYLEYDSNGVWRYAGEVSATATTSKMLPVRPRRCDHLRMKFIGSGDIRIYSIAKILVKGSDA